VTLLTEISVHCLVQQYTSAICISDINHPVFISRRSPVGEAGDIVTNSSVRKSIRPYVRVYVTTLQGPIS